MQTVTVIRWARVSGHGLARKLCSLRLQLDRESENPVWKLARRKTMFQKYSRVLNQLSPHEERAEAFMFKASRDRIFPIARKGV
jgi:hypothetical protein